MPVCENVRSVLDRVEEVREERRSRELSVEAIQELARQEAVDLFVQMMGAVNELIRAGVRFYDRKGDQEYQIVNPSRNHHRFLRYDTPLGHEKGLRIRVDPPVLNLSGGRIDGARIQILQHRPSGWEDRKCFYNVDRALDWLAQVVVEHERRDG
jgi:hypothetical protein